MTEELMDARMVALATVTWVRTAHEESVLRSSLSRLAGLGMPVAVADTGVNTGFLQFLHSLPGFDVHVATERGLAAQVITSIEIAARRETPFILYTEPDKEMFFDQIADFVGQSDGSPDVGIVLAARSDESFRTFPPTQRYTESIVNHLCGEFVGTPGDYAYGPFIMNRALLPVVRSLQPTLGWGWRPFLFNAAHRHGLRVIQVPDDRPCPLDQREEDERERAHRLRQLSENILGLV
jgi:hypothetical protein